MHVYLDPAGGVAGDIFVAALLDAWPELAEALPISQHSLDEAELAKRNPGSASESRIPAFDLCPGNAC